MNSERVLVIPRTVFENAGAFQGLQVTGLPVYLKAFFDPGSNLFLERSVAETDPGHKQLIPYAILKRSGRLLHYVRGGGSGEKRLVAKGSIGIGGHLNELDSMHLDENAYERLVLRELHEELDIDGSFDNRIVALLNDDSTEVGRVHLGIVHVLDLDSSASIKVREQDIQDLQWRSPDELRQHLGELETWSRLCVENLSRLGIGGMDDFQ